MNIKPCPPPSNFITEIETEFLESSCAMLEFSDIQRWILKDVRDGQVLRGTGM